MEDTSFVPGAVASKPVGACEGQERAGVMLQGGSGWRDAKLVLLVPNCLAGAAPRAYCRLKPGVNKHLSSVEDHQSPGLNGRTEFFESRGALGL